MRCLFCRLGLSSAQERDFLLEHRSQMPFTWRADSPPTSLASPSWSPLLFLNIPGFSWGISVTHRLTFITCFHGFYSGIMFTILRAQLYLCPHQLLEGGSQYHILSNQNFNSAATAGGCPPSTLPPPLCFCNPSPLISKTSWTRQTEFQSLAVTCLARHFCNWAEAA